MTETTLIREATPHTDVDRCPSGGGAEARWADDERIPYWITLGAHIFAFDLMHITTECGADVALTVDNRRGPCEICGLNTYGGGVCLQCEDIAVEELRSKRGPAVALELAGTFTPRCDF